MKVPQRFSFFPQGNLTRPKPLKTQRVYQFGPFRLQREPLLLWREAAIVALPPKALEVLLALVTHAGELVEKRTLMDRVWPDTFVEEGNLTQTISLVRKALGEAQGQQRWIETVPKRGYRFTCQVQEVDATCANRTDFAPRQSRPTKMWVLASLLVAGALAAGTLLYGLSSRMRLASLVPALREAIGYASHAPAVRSLVVLPLRNLSGDAAQEYVADGVTESLIGELAKIGSLRVISRTSAMHYKHTTKLLPEIARELKVDAALEGSVAVSSGRVRVSVELIYASLDRPLWSRNYERALSDLVPLESEIALALAHRIQLTLTPSERSRLARARPVDQKVQLAYLQGYYLYWNRRTPEDLQRAIQYFQSAIRDDPAYAPAYAALARAYQVMGVAYSGTRSPVEVRPMELAAAQKAVELDPDLAAGHSALALLAYELYDWPAGQAHVDRALALNPNHVETRAFYAQILAARGRFDEALVQARLAREIDPISPIVGTSLGFVYEMARQYDRAIQQLLRVHELDPNYYAAAWFLARAYASNSQFEESIEMAKTAARLSNDSPGSLGVLGGAYALAGRKAEAMQILQKLQALSKRQYVTPTSFMDIYLGLRDRENAIKWLEKAYEERSYYLCYIHVLPAFDLLRSDPRFQEVVRRVGIAGR